MTQVQLIARHTITAGNEDTVFALLEKLVAAARTEPGNLAFEVYRKADDARSYALLERYTSRDALTAHRDAPHFKDYLLGQIVPLLKSRVVEEYDVTD
jgi:quinol monooxygenase YgiN